MKERRGWRAGHRICGCAIALNRHWGEKEQINMVARHTTHNHTEKVWLNEAKTETRMTQMESEFRLFVLVLFHFYV